jgi:DNA-binding LytR/AlgR family response regulator
MTILKCLIVTENPVLYKILSDYINNHHNLELLPPLHQLTVVSTQTSGFDQVDILLIDVKRNVSSLLKILLQYFKKIDHLVWIADAGDFKNTPMSASDLYHLKTPVTTEKLHKLIKLVMVRIENREHTIQINSPKGIYIKSSEKDIGYVHCHVTEITVIEVMNKALTIHTTERGTITANLPLSKIEAKLGGGYFIRISRSFMVSERYIDRVSGNIVHMLKYAHQLKIGSTYLDSVHRRILINTLNYE